MNDKPGDERKFGRVLYIDALDLPAFEYPPDQKFNIVVNSHPGSGAYSYKRQDPIHVFTPEELSKHDEEVARKAYLFVSLKWWDNEYNYGDNQPDMASFEAKFKSYWAAIQDKK